MWRACALLLLLGVSSDAAQLRRQRLANFAQVFEVSVDADATLHAAFGAAPRNLNEYCSGGAAGAAGHGAASSGAGIHTFHKGDRILGDWKNYGHWYPGKIIECNGDGTYDIKYDDGYTERHVKPENVKDPDIPEEPEGVDPSNDAACELAEDADNLAKKISETGRIVSRYIAEKSSEDAEAKLDSSEADNEAREKERELAKAREEAKKRAMDDANDFSSSWRNRYSGWDWRSWSNRDDYWKKYKAEAEAAKAEVRGESPGPAPAPAAVVPQGLEESAKETGGDLVDVKTEIIDVETEIHELEIQVADNDEKLKEFRLGTKGDKVASSTAAAADPSAPTLDDLIEAYRKRLEERKKRREELKKIVEDQSKELEEYAKGSKNEKVTVETLEEATKEVEKEIEKVWAKREKLIKEKRMDDELDHAIKQVKEDAEKVAGKVDKIAEAEQEAAKAREASKKAEEVAAARLEKEREKSREEVRRLKERLAEAEASAAGARDAGARDAGQEAEAAEARRQIEQLQAKNAAAEAKAAKDVAEQKAAKEAAQKKLLEVSQSAEEEVHKATQKAEHLNTGLTPSAEKWWRYRYEWSYVEAGLMIWIVFLMLFWEAVFQRMSIYVKGFIVGGHERLFVLSMATQGTIQEMWLRSFAEMLFNCTMTFMTVWMMAKTGLWEYSHFLLRPPGGGLHLPHDVQEYRRIAVDLCAILFFAVICFYGLALAVVRIAEVLLQKLAEECHDGNVQTSARGRSVMTKVVAFAAVHGSWAIVQLEYDFLKENWQSLVREDGDLDSYTKREFTKPEFNFLLYMRLSIKSKADMFMEFGWPVWLMIVVTFYGHLCLHLHYHVAYVRIMTFYLCLTILLLAGMTVRILQFNREVKKGLDEDEDQVSPLQRQRSEQFRKSFEAGDWLFFSVLNYLLFMMCYGFARMVCNSWMWEMYFWNVVWVFCFTLGLALFFTLVIAPLVPVYGALSALPPNLTEKNLEFAMLAAEGPMSPKGQMRAPAAAK